MDIYDLVLLYGAQRDKKETHTTVQHSGEWVVTSKTIFPAGLDYKYKCVWNLKYSKGQIKCGNQVNINMLNLLGLWLYKL